MRGQKGGGSSSAGVTGGFSAPVGAGPAGSIAGARIPGGRVVRVTLDGVVTCRVPSSSMTKRQPRASVFSRWRLRHRQHRFAQSVAPPQACGMTWSASAQPTPLAAVGEAAAAVAGGDKGVLGGGGGVGGGRLRPGEHRAAAVAVGVLAAAALGQPGQLFQGAGGQQPTVAVGDREGQRPALRCPQPQRPDAGQQLADVRGGDRQPVHRTRRARGALQGVQGGSEVCVRPTAASGTCAGTVRPSRQGGGDRPHALRGGTR